MGTPFAVWIINAWKSCNDTFGTLAAKHKFHAYIQNLPTNLVKQLEDFLEFAERENFAFLFFFLTSGRSVSVLNLWKMAEAKVVRVLVEMSHDKLMEFMDFVDRINGDV